MLIFKKHLHFWGKNHTQLFEKKKQQPNTEIGSICQPRQSVGGSLVKLTFFYLLWVLFQCKKGALSVSTTVTQVQKTHFYV